MSQESKPLPPASLWCCAYLRNQSRCHQPHCSAVYVSATEVAATNLLRCCAFRHPRHLAPHILCQTRCWCADRGLRNSLLQFISPLVHTNNAHSTGKGMCQPCRRHLHAYTHTHTHTQTHTHTHTRTHTHTHHRQTYCRSCRRHLCTHKHTHSLSSHAICRCARAHTHIHTHIHIHTDMH
jgi:hypothetical protein